MKFGFVMQHRFFPVIATANKVKQEATGKEKEVRRLMSDSDQGVGDEEAEQNYRTMNGATQQTMP